MEKLTERQMEVLELKAWGASNKMIGAILNIATNTVTNHLRAIYEYLRINSSTEAAAWFFTNRYNIPVSQNPLKNKDLLKKAGLMMILIISMLPAVANAGKSKVRMVNMKRSQTVVRVTYKTGKK